MTAHHFSTRVWYEDTDLAGIVYYANYLKFIERGRSQMIADAGIDQMALRDVHGIVFAVRKLSADYLVPGKFGDVLDVATTVKAVTGARITLHQAVLRGDTDVFKAEVELACLTPEGRPARLPPDIRARLALVG